MTGEPTQAVSRRARIAHLGLGAFFRAHQAWYTAHAPDGDEWPIAAFTGRRPDLAQALTAQGCQYTLIERHPDGDRAEVIRSIARAHPGTDADAWRSTLADSDVAVVTLTVTEAGYDAGSSVLTRLLDGLRARRAAEAGPIAIVSCDNLPGNGTVLKRALGALAQHTKPQVWAWAEENVSFVSTVVDRITPAATDDDAIAAKALTGWADRCPVVTEPFSEWIMAGEFPAGRPTWEDAGVRFVGDVDVFERRKLWLLNGAHSLLAYAGATRGHLTVADAMADDVCAGWVDEWWDAAQRHLELGAGEVAAYRSALAERFRNPRIRHRLEQIGMDGSRKLPVRALPVLRAELAAGREPVGPARLLAAWIRHLRGETFDVRDPSGSELLAAAQGPPSAATRSVLNLLDVELAGSDDVVRLCARLIDDLG